MASNEVEEGSHMLVHPREHHLGNGTTSKQTLGELVFFYAYGEDGSSGVCMAINRDLHPKMVFKHSSRRAIGIQVTLKESTVLIVNVYALNSAKLRGGLWQYLLQEQFLGEWILVGDFNMVQSCQDRTGPSAIHSGTELARWKALEEKWSLVDAW